MRYLLDTNTCIHAMRGRASVTNAMVAHAPQDFSMSSVTCYELYTGVEKCADPARERSKVDTFVSTINQVAFDVPAALASARVRAELEARGEMIGPYDVLLAGHALSLGLIFVTGNTGEFARIPGLVIENWQSKAT